MPPEQGIGFEDQMCVFPVLNVTGNQDEPEALGSSEAWFFDSPVEDDELLPEQGILGDELGFASG